MENEKLKKAYEAVEMLRALDLPVSKDQLNAIAEMERECLLEEVTPRIQKILKPIVKNMNTSFRIDISYTPETGLVINTVDNKRPYRRSTDESDTGHRSRTKVGTLRVTYPDGRVIEHNKASQTLIGLSPANHLFQKKDILIVNKKETVGILLPILAHPSRKNKFRIYLSCSS